MSRTYRRQDRPEPKWITHDWKGTGYQGVSRYCLLEGDELKRSIARYHSDRDYHTSPSKWWTRNEWSKFRARARMELHRWYRNSDHEVQIRANPKWPWWD